MAITSAAHCAAAAVAITRKRQRPRLGWPSCMNTPGDQSLWPSPKRDATPSTSWVGNILDSAAAEFRRANEGHSYAEVAIFPAAFLMRHGLELMAKQMSIYMAYEYRNASLLYKREHSLEVLWSSVRQYVELHSDPTSFHDPCEGRYAARMHPTAAFQLI